MPSDDDDDNFMSSLEGSDFPTCKVVHVVVTNLLILFVHVGTTGRYHNESLDSLTIILLYGSFLKIVINI